MKISYVKAFDWILFIYSFLRCYTKYPCNHEGMYTFSDGGKIQDRQCGCLYRDGWVAIGTKVPFSRNDPDLGCKRPETLPPEGQQLSDEYGEESYICDRAL